MAGLWEKLDDDGTVIEVKNTFFAPLTKCLTA